MELLPRLKDGAIAKELYQHALSFVKEKKPDLESHFVKNIGHGVCVYAVFFASFLTYYTTDWYGVP